MYTVQFEVIIMKEINESKGDFTVLHLTWRSTFELFNFASLLTNSFRKRSMFAINSLICICNQRACADTNDTEIDHCNSKVN